MTDIETDTSNQVCTFRLTSPDVDYKPQLEEFAKSNPHLADYQIQ